MLASCPPLAPATERPFLLPTGVLQCAAPLPLPVAGPRSTAQARAGRALEFDTGRSLARTLLARLGARSLDVPAGADRAPVWPPGFVGSITHTRGWVGVALAHAGACRALGIDAEVIDPHQDLHHIESTCLAPRELALWDPSACSRQAFLILCFSAKESLYKCLYPLVGRFFDFSDAEIVALDLSAGTVRIALLGDLGRGFTAGRVLEGSAVLAGHYAFTAVWLEQA